MITYANHTFYDGDQPILLLAGEIHYFRLPSISWDMHLKILKETGCNTVSTYVPWLLHQELEDEIDFDGHTLDVLNLIHFLELAKKHHLFVFLRPGPFIMAELKNEGIPYWIYEKHPHIVPKTWDEKRVTSATVDYLDPSFLTETRKWFKKLYQVIHPYLQENGGPIIGIQLDNEVGMLSWVTNNPDLTDGIKQMLIHKGMSPTTSFYSPSESESLIYHQLLGRVMRKRFKTYLEKLAKMWVDLGVKQVLYFINIHGTSNGRGKTFPIGISQLVDTYQNNQLIPGTDVYFGNLNLENFHDLYIINQMTLATLSDDKPITTLEFNAGDGNFGDNLSIRYLPSALDFKLRMSIAQSHKLINYYLFTGGFNPRFKHLSSIDGNDRIASTGERHGFAAPIQPNGAKGYTYEKMQETTLMLSHLSHKLSLMSEETDQIYLGINLDDYMTEYRYPKSQLIKEVTDNLEFHRQSILWDNLLKHMLLLHYSFKALRLTTQSIDPTLYPVLILNTSKFMPIKLQKMLIEYHQLGGKLILVGELPLFDYEMNEATLLIDYIKVKPIKRYVDWEYPNLSLISQFDIKDAKEFRTFYAQTIETNHQSLFNMYPNLEPSGLKMERLIWITSSYPGDLTITKRFLDALNIKPKYELKDHKGHLFFTKQSYQGESFLHVMNLDHFDQTYRLFEDGKPLFKGKPLSIFAQEAVMLPQRVVLGDFLIVDSTAEISSYKKDYIVFRLTQPVDRISIDTKRILLSNSDYSFTKDGNHYHIFSNHHAKIKERITLYFN
jgi:beta-galactosidase